MKFIKQGRLVGAKCKDCGSFFFPMRMICGNCLSNRLEEVLLSKRGKLYSYTVSYVNPTGFKAPYAFGLIELPEGVRIYSLLTTHENLEIGMEMELTIDTLDGKQIYRFKPVGDR